MVANISGGGLGDLPLGGKYIRCFRVGRGYRERISCNSSRVSSSLDAVGTMESTQVYERQSCSGSVFERIDRRQELTPNIFRCERVAGIFSSCHLAYGRSCVSFALEGARLCKQYIGHSPKSESKHSAVRTHIVLKSQND